MDGWMTAIVHWYCTCFDEWLIVLLIQIGHNLYTYVCYVKKYNVLTIHLKLHKNDEHDDSDETIHHKMWYMMINLTILLLQCFLSTNKHVAHKVSSISSNDSVSSASNRKWNPFEGWFLNIFPCCMNGFYCSIVSKIDNIIMS